LRNRIDYLKSHDKISKKCFAPQYIKGFIIYTAAMVFLWAFLKIIKGHKGNFQKANN